MTLLYLAPLLVGVLMLSACGPGRAPPPKVSGELVVAVRNSPTTYFTDRHGAPAGFEYDLVAGFAARHGWRVRLVPAQDLGTLQGLVRQGRVNLAAAGLTVTAARQAGMRFGPEYGRIQEWVVCHRAVTRPSRLEDLAAHPGLRLEALAGSSHAEYLQARAVPGLNWVEMHLHSPEDLLQRVDLGLTDCAVADSDSLALAHNFYPNLHDAFVLRPHLAQAWALPPDADAELVHALTAYFRHLHDSGELVRLRERYFGHAEHLQDADVIGIHARRVRLLPALVGYFHEAQRLTGLDWRLLAALAYQESKWDAHAVSPTGVRGIMMLTVATADHLGVENRLDARQSILGGARYLLELRDALPASISEPDRTWFALAAYNIGPGHLEDARRLARRLGRNPDAWADMKRVLPLLAQARYHPHLRLGFARGGEARVLTENVRIYYDILRRAERPYIEMMGSRARPAAALPRAPIDALVYIRRPKPTGRGGWGKLLYSGRCKATPTRSRARAANIMAGI